MHARGLIPAGDEKAPSRVGAQIACDRGDPGRRPSRPLPRQRPPDARPPPQASADVLFQCAGKCSWFGGPEDTGVEDEGLAFIYDVDEAPHLFLEEQPQDTSGLARRLDPGVNYVACRWDYDQTPKGMLANPMRKAAVFPPLAAHLLTVGEETGRLDQMFVRTADIYETETRA